MTSHLSADNDAHSTDGLFMRVEQALLLAALSEETAAWCRQNAALRISTDDDDHGNHSPGT